MADDIPFKKDFAFDYGVAAQVSPLIRRVIAHNPSAFTQAGTGTYIVGRGTVAIIDPGPDDTDHIAALLQAVRGETVSHILITHTHRDHSPAARTLKAVTGAPAYGFGPHGGLNRSEDEVEEGADWTFRPDVTLADGDVVSGPGWTIEAVHTPGHTSNHLCFGLCEEKALFTGDHIMGWATSVISPPDGHMGDYRLSLRKLLERGDVIYYPTHGAPIENPHQMVRAFLAHRKMRDGQILACLDKGLDTIPAMVAAMYADTDPRLHPAAGRSVFAHLIDLVEQGRVIAVPQPSLGGRYSLPS